MSRRRALNLKQNANRARALKYINLRAKFISELTYEEIADFLNRSGYTTITGKPWCRQTLCNFLKVEGLKIR